MYHLLRLDAILQPTVNLTRRPSSSYIVTLRHHLSHYATICVTASVTNPPNRRRLYRQAAMLLASYRSVHISSRVNYNNISSSLKLGLEVIVVTTTDSVATSR